jgi:hypothetical protein
MRRHVHRARAQGVLVAGLGPLLLCFRRTGIPHHAAAKGGRFGPHQHAETVNSQINRFPDKLAWIAYFNAGVRVLDLSDPYNLREVGYYIPKTNANSHPMAKG